MKKTLKAAEEGEAVDALDFVGALNEKKERTKNKKKGYQKLLKKTIGNIKEEENRNKEFRNTIEKKVKLCPLCGYLTKIEHHTFLCVRKCKQCSWKSKPFRKNTNIFAL